MKRAGEIRKNIKCLLRRISLLFCLGAALLFHDGATGVLAESSMMAKTGQIRQKLAASDSARQKWNAYLQWLQPYLQRYMRTHRVYVLQPGFEELYAANPDICGWLNVADFVDEPVLWRDNSFYLDHGFDREDSIDGAIFLDERGEKYAEEPSLLVYGHNMKSGAMFGLMDYYREADYLKQYPIVTYQSAWEKEPRKYVLFSLFDASMTPGNAEYQCIVWYPFRSREEHQAYLDQLKARSFYRVPIDVTVDDQLIALVTCSYSQDNGRFLVTGRRLRAGEDEEELRRVIADSIFRTEK